MYYLINLWQHFYAEYGSIDADGKPVDTSKRVKWAHNVDKNDYTIDKVLADTDKPEWYIVKQ